MSRRFPLAIILILVSFLLSGCWNNRDLTELSICSAIGIDRMEDGRIMLTAQIVKPSAARASGKEGGGGEDKPFVTVSYTADTVFGALRGMLSKVNKKIFYSSSQVVVIGEEAARSGIIDYIDFLRRDHESQYKSDVVIAKGVSAKEIIEQEYDLSKVPGLFIVDTLRNTSSRAMAKRTMLIEMMKVLVSDDKQLSLGTITKSGDTTSTEGLAVFLESRLVGWLDKFETRGYLFIADELKSTILEIPNPDNPAKLIAIELIDSKSKLGLEWSKDGKPVFTVDIKPRGNIGEIHDGLKLENQEIVKKMQEECNKKIKKEVLSALEKCRKEYKSDIFGFGSLIYKNNPGYWRQIKNNWSREGLSKAGIRVNVDTEIRKSGLSINPIEVSK